MLSRTALLAVAMALALVAAVAAVPVARRRLEAIAATQDAVDADVDAEDAADVEADAAEAVALNPAAPLLSGSFHVKYSIYAINHASRLLPSLANLLDRASKLIDGEAWQNVGADGAVTIKTETNPTLIGRIVTGAMTQTWVKDHGWTLKKKDGSCTRDTVNTQLVVSGTILRETGVFKGTRQLKPIARIAGRPAARDGSYAVDQWDATLPNDEGTVTYYLFSKTTTPMMSHYRLKGKPPVWAQYHVFEPMTNPDSTYAPQPACAKAAADGAKAPATVTLAKLDHLEAAKHTAPKPKKRATAKAKTNAKL